MGVNNYSMPTVHKVFYLPHHVHLTCIDYCEMPNTIYICYYLHYVKEEVWSIFSWFPSAVSRLLPFTV